MRVLALDTTTRVGSVAIANDTVVIYDALGAAERSHTERLPLDLDRALSAAGMALEDMDLFAVAVGPGSFTGMRTGIATIQGLAMVTGKPVVPVSALEALAESARASTAPGARIGAWMDAYRRDVFTALYEVPADAEEDLRVIEDARVELPAAVWARWTSGSDPQLALSGSDPNYGSDPMLIGDGAVRYAEVAGGHVRVMPPPALAPSIARIGARRGRRGDTLPPGRVLPLYVRRPDVEVTRELQQRQ